jgi:hypothetical protein
MKREDDARMERNQLAEAYILARDSVPLTSPQIHQPPTTPVTSPHTNYQIDKQINHGSDVTQLYVSDVTNRVSDVNIHVSDVTTYSLPNPPINHQPINHVSDVTTCPSPNYVS